MRLKWLPMIRNGPCVGMFDRPVTRTSIANQAIKRTMAVTRRRARVFMGEGYQRSVRAGGPFSSQYTESGAAAYQPLKASLRAC